MNVLLKSHRMEGIFFFFFVNINIMLQVGLPVISSEMYQDLNEVFQGVLWKVYIIGYLLHRTP